MRLRFIQLGYMLTGLAWLLGAGPALAADYKIAIVDLQRAASTSPQAEAAQKRIEREFRDRDRQLIAKQKQIRKLEEDLLRNREVMSEEQLTRKDRDIRRERREYQRAVGEFNEDRTVRRNEELQRLQNEVIEVTQKLAQDEKYDLVLIRGVVVFADEKKMDITDRVIALLKRRGKR